MKKNNNKGFTLVELIVVLVILAILAAILVPALLGYIDKAKQAQYEEEAHSILVATQAYETEQYAKGKAAETSIATMKTYIDPIVSPTEVTSGTVSFTGKGTGSHGNYTVKSIKTLVFTSQKEDKTVTCDIDDGSITIISVK